MNNTEKRRQDLEWLLRGCPDILSPIQAARWTKKSTSEIRYPNEIREDFSEWLTKRWCHRKDTISLKEIEKLLGYEHESVRRWINRGHLKCVKAQGEEIIAKEWLISFLSDYGFKIAKKSQKHQELITEFLK